MKYYNLKKDTCDANFLKYMTRLEINNKREQK